MDIRTRLNWMDRADFVAMLEGVGIACFDTESTDSLKEAVFVNIEDGTIQL